MTESSILWLSTSPSLKWIDLKLISRISQARPLYLWEFEQEADQGCDLNVVLDLLYEYLKLQQDKNHNPIHIVGHGINGVVGALFARKHPELVRSLTLLSVGASLSCTWHAQYYAKRSFFEGTQLQTLMYLSQQLFGNAPPYNVRQLASMFQEDLLQSPIPHSLFDVQALPKGGTKVPTLYCGGEYDTITDAHSVHDWEPWMKPFDDLWICPRGRHFFHHEFPMETAHVIEQFHRRLEQRKIGKFMRTDSPLAASYGSPSMSRIR